MKTVITVFIILGMIATPWQLCYSLSQVIGSGNPMLFLGLLAYFFTIPVGIITLVKVKNAVSKGDVISWGVLSLLLVSLVGGILILAASDSVYAKSYPADTVMYKDSEEKVEKPEVINPVPDEPEQADTPDPYGKQQ
jgi:hypothetical protein